jgi:hypothetical protein
MPVLLELNDRVTGVGRAIGLVISRLRSNDVRELAF